MNLIACVSFALWYFLISSERPIADRYIEVAPEDVIWSNLGLNPYEQKVRYALHICTFSAS